MSTETIEVKGKQLRTVARVVDAQLTEGRDVVLNFGRHAKPERVLESLNLLVGTYDVELTIRHAELREYLENATAGGLLGAAIGTIAALALPGPATVALVLQGAGIGAIAGALIGGGLTQVQEITVYKHRGETRVKLVCAN